MKSKKYWHIILNKTVNKQFKNTSPSIYSEMRKNDTETMRTGRLDTECGHQLWIKRCSFCNGIMESDAKTNFQPGPPMKTLYTGFEKLVCDYELALKMLDVKAPQKSKLYWAHRLDTDIVTLRSIENMKTEGYKIAAAFTSSELCELLNKLPVEVDKEYIGSNAHLPNRLARLYIRLKKSL